MADSTPSFSNRALPPQNIDAEESILGGILLDPEAMGRVVDILVINAFYVQAHRDIYKGLLILHAQGKPTDLMTLSAWLKDQTLLEKIGGTAKLVHLVDRTVSAVNVDRYAQLVMDKYVRRQLIAGGHEIVDLGFDTVKPLEEVLDESEQKIFRLTQERPQEGLTPIAETIVETFNNIEELHQDLALPGLSCGFYDLDAMTSGFQRSDLIIIAGRPAMGKTSFALNVAVNIAKEHKLPVAVFSLEMSKEQLVQRLLAGEAKIESNRLRSGRLTQTDMEPLIMAVESLSNVSLFLDDTANLTVAQMRSQSRKLQAEQGGKLGLILIDYLQLMEGSSDNRVQEISKITRSLKGLARELNVPIIALSQLSRGVEARTNKRPMMSDLRESGCLTGDSLITLSDTGKQVPIRSLVGQSGFRVWALNETTMQLEKAIASNAFATGVKPVYRLTTRLGRTIKATANHKFRSFLGWRRLDELAVGDRLALPRTIPSSETQNLTNNQFNSIQHNTNRDVIPLIAWQTYAVPAMVNQGMTTRTMQAQLQMSYCGSTLYRTNLSRQRALKVAQVVKSPELSTLAQSDIYWDEIVSIEADGMEEVFDLTVPSLHNFVANNLVVHNSIEQDADLIIMLYRDSYYNPDSPDRDIAEVIITKHRNGPTGTVKLIFQPELTKFLNLANSGNPYAEVY